MYVGKSASCESRRFDRTKDCERHIKKMLPVELIPVHRVAILSLVFGILVTTNAIIITVLCISQVGLAE